MKLIELKNINNHKLELPREVDYILYNFKGSILAGGAIRDGLHGKEISDYDLFFTDLLTVALIKEYLPSVGYNLVFACPQGLLYTFKMDDIKIQLICKRRYEDVYDLLDSFDFTICQYAITGTSGVYTTRQAIKDSKTNTLNLHKLTFPSATINRLSKYKKKGYYAGKAIKQIVQAIVNIAPEDYDENLDSLYVD